MKSVMVLLFSLFTFGLSAQWVSNICGTNATTNANGLGYSYRYAHDSQNLGLRFFSIERTTNGWDSISYLSTPSSIYGYDYIPRNIHPIGDSAFYLELENRGGYSGRPSHQLYKTTDLGNNYTPVEIQGYSYYMKVIDATTSLYISNDSGFFKLYKLQNDSLSTELFTLNQSNSSNINFGSFNAFSQKGKNFKLSFSEYNQIGSPPNVSYISIQKMLKFNIDSINSYTVIGSDSNINLYKVQMIDSTDGYGLSLGYLNNANPTLYKTTNEGRNWQVLTILDSTYNYSDMKVGQNPNEIALTTLDSTVFKSIDGGLNFSLINLPIGQIINLSSAPRFNGLTHLDYYDSANYYFYYRETTNFPQVVHAIKSSNHKITEVRKFYKNETTFAIYPNPTSSILNIGSSDLQNAPFQVFNLQGQLVKEGSINHQEIEVSDLHEGIYLLSIFTEGTTYRQKFIKH